LPRQQADENAGTVWFLPYLSGERTPHNNPEAKGVFFGLTHQHGPAELARAVLEGVGYALADGMDVVHDCGLKPQHHPDWRRRAQPLLAADAG
jgi:xylulokinase